MFRTFFIQRRRIASLALLAMLLRVAVPVGFMPSALTDGWYLKLCSDGVSGSAMMALLGQQDHAHHHQGVMSEKGGSSERAFDQCDLGSGFAAAVIVQEVTLALGLLVFIFIAGPLFVATLQPRPGLYLARAPPQAIPT